MPHVLHEKKRGGGGGGGGGEGAGYIIISDKLQMVPDERN